jgi:hypothetical protein
MLDDFIPGPQLVEVDHVDVAATPERAYAAMRELDLARSPVLRVVLRLARRLDIEAFGPFTARIADIGRAGSGFTMLEDVPARTLTIGAIGRLWEPGAELLDIPAGRFATMAEPGYGKVVLQLRFCALGDDGTRIETELRLSATDDLSWAAMRRHYRLVGPFARFARHHVLAMLQRELDTPEHAENDRPMPGDELLPLGASRVTHGITIAAPPEAIWPWLVQMGGGRAGWYSHDELDNAGRPSARVIVPALQQLELGDVLPEAPGASDGLTVVALDPPRSLVLAAMRDRAADESIEFFAPLPEHYWRATWAFALRPIDATHTRLVARASVDFSPTMVGLRVLWMRPIHRIMQGAQLHNIAKRAEGTLAHHDDRLRDLAEAAVGAAGMLTALATPFLRRRRAHWGISEQLAARKYPGDDFLPEPRWQWTHAIEIDASPAAVWPWIAQIGSDKAGFYSYQFLENLAGCDIQNADHIVERWQNPAVGDTLRLHPEIPGLPIVEVEPGRWLLAQTQDGMRASWLFFVEPLDDGRRARLVSRYRCGTATDLATRVAYATVIEPIGYVMDRQMLRGVKARAEAKG